jgi:hypothetical protein
MLEADLKKKEQNHKIGHQDVIQCAPLHIESSSALEQWTHNNLNNMDLWKHTKVMRTRSGMHDPY